MPVLDFLQRRCLHNFRKLLLFFISNSHSFSSKKMWTEALLPNDSLLDFLRLNCLRLQTSYCMKRKKMHFFIITIKILYYFGVLKRSSRTKKQTNWFPKLFSDGFSSKQAKNLVSISRKHSDIERFCIKTKTFEFDDKFTLDAITSNVFIFIYSDSRLLNTAEGNLF
jgi:hypothetical protein